ncbi:MAG: Asp23/Gls24 family envelope stress response protein, partial [Clostridia bacterium]|nr:Asp23/Gls24 family envelope stress response protein [Clostridia bacterium]
DPLNLLRRRGTGSYETMGEKSVIRPTYSYMGNFTISDYTIYQLAEHAAKQNEAVAKITRFRADKADAGIRIEMDVVLYYGYKIPQVFSNIRKAIAEEVEIYTSLNTVAVVLTAKNIIVKDKPGVETAAKDGTEAL